MSRVTIGTLAERLNLSTASVSYALNDRPGVSPATRERVLALATELGWRPSSSALALKQSRANTIGIVLGRAAADLGSEPYYMRVLEGIQDALAHERNGLLLRITDPGSKDDLKVYQDWYAEQRVDGVIIFDLLVRDPRPRLLRSLGLPFVIQGVLHGDTLRTATFESQAEDAALLVGHVADLGHRTIAHVSGRLGIAHETHRSRCVQAEARRYGLELITIESDYTLEDAERRVAEALKSAPELTALICSNDLMAVGGVRATRAAARPDVAVASWDDSLLCTISSPTITALNRHIDDTGRRSARALLSLIAGQPISPADDRPIPSELRVRESSTRSSGPRRRRPSQRGPRTRA